MHSTKKTVCFIAVRSLLNFVQQTQTVQRLKYTIFKMTYVADPSVFAREMDQLENFTINRHRLPSMTTNPIG